MLIPLEYQIDDWLKLISHMHEGTNRIQQDIA